MCGYLTGFMAATVGAEGDFGGVEGDGLAADGQWRGLVMV